MHLAKNVLLHEVIVDNIRKKIIAFCIEEFSGQQYSPSDNTVRLNIGHPFYHLTPMPCTSCHAFSLPDPFYLPTILVPPPPPIMNEDRRARSGLHAYEPHFGTLPHTYNNPWVTLSGWSLPRLHPCPDLMLTITLTRITHSLRSFHAYLHARPPNVDT